MTIDTALDRYDSGRLTRRELLQALVVAGVVQPRTAGSIFKGRELNHVTLGVKDVQRSREFYARVLGLPVQRTLDTPYREVQFLFQNSLIGYPHAVGNGRESRHRSPSAYRKKASHMASAVGCNVASARRSSIAGKFESTRCRARVVDLNNALRVGQSAALTATSNVHHPGTC